MTFELLNYIKMLVKLLQLSMVTFIFPTPRPSHLDLPLKVVTLQVHKVH
jgi:hypothetical protein